MPLRTAARALLLTAVILPVVQAVLWWVGGMLRAMGDRQGAALVGHVGTACQVVWAVDVVALLLVVAWLVLESDRPPAAPPQEQDR